MPENRSVVSILPASVARVVGSAILIPTVCRAWCAPATRCPWASGGGPCRSPRAWRCSCSGSRRPPPDSEQQHAVILVRNQGVCLNSIRSNSALVSTRYILRITCGNPGTKSGPVSTRQYGAVRECCVKRPPCTPFPWLGGRSHVPPRTADLGNTESAESTICRRFWARQRELHNATLADQW